MTRSKTAFTAAVVLALGGALAATAPAVHAQEISAAQFAATTLQLSAEGEVRVKPDLAVLSLGVQADAPTAEAAFAKARAQMAATVAALHVQGVADADIQTADFSLQAQYADDAPTGSTGQGPRRLTGYEATNTVTVRLHDLSRVGKLVDALVAAGANRVDQISFQLADPTAARDEARRKALQALQREANLEAQGVGYRVSRLVRLSDFEARPPIVQPMMFAAKMAVQESTVAPGELTISATVNGLYELTPAR